MKLKCLHFKRSLLFCVIILFQVCSPGNSQEYQILNTPIKVKDELGNLREYRLFLPPSKEDIPLLVYFHGVRSECFKKNPALKTYTGSPVEETGWVEFCKLNKIALLAPKAKYEYQFLNCPSKGWSPFKKEINGIEKMIDQVVEKFNISQREIYLVGISAGAVLCHHLANRRPTYYNSILSHSQGYISENNQLLTPFKQGPMFGVVIGYTRGDYKDLIPICTESERIYKEKGYRTVLLDKLPPRDHSWAKQYNRKFWRMLKRVGQYSHEIE